MGIENLFNKLLCLAGLHAWYECDIDFFDPTNIYEECSICHIHRKRKDKK